MVWIEARTLDTDNSSRDEDMQKSLDVATFPQIVFTLDTVDGKLADGRGDLVGHGRFNVKGVETTKVFDFKVEPAESGTMHVTGDAKLSLKEHDVKPPRVLFIKVKDEVRVWFDLRLAKVPEKSIEAKLCIVDVEFRELKGPGDFGKLPEGGVKIQERIWTTPSGSLWEMADPRRWVMDSVHGTDLFDVRSGMKVEERGVEGPPVQSLETLEPTPGTKIVRSGGREWIKAEGLTGDFPLGRFISASELLPSEVVKQAGPMRGVPERLKVRGESNSSSSNSSSLKRPLSVEWQRVYVFGAEQPATLPDWVMDPTSWLRPPEVGKSPKKRMERRPDDGDR